LILPLPDYGINWVFHCVRTSNPAGSPTVNPAPTSASGAPVIESTEEDGVKGTWDIIQVTYNTQDAADVANGIVGSQYYSPNVDYDWTSYGQSFVFTDKNFQFWGSGSMINDSTYEWVKENELLRAAANGNTADWTVKIEGNKLILENAGVTYVCTRVGTAVKGPGTSDSSHTEYWIVLLAAAAVCVTAAGTAYAKRRR
ncbi:MAG: hypothetical protein IKG08_01205, partial [Eubacterium sp.]|nr:hypothetical protein [Eubacterium sp.]